MIENVYFFDVFSDYDPPQEQYAALQFCRLVQGEINQTERKIHVAFDTDNYIPRRCFDEVEDWLSGHYQLRNVSVECSFPASQVSAIEAEELRDLFVQQDSMARGYLAGALWQWEDNTLTVCIKSNGKQELEKSIPVVKQLLHKRFGAEVEIHIDSACTLEGQALFEAMEKMRQEMVEDLPKLAAEEKKAAPVVSNEAIFGKPFRGKAVAMKDLNLDMGSVIVEGKVFALDHKELTKRNAHVIKFDMTDTTSSVRVSRFMEKKEAEPVLEAIKEGSEIRVIGRMMIDNYTNEMVLKPNAIMPHKMEKRVDTARDGKRVELHLHTAMSNMDATTSTKDAIKLAARWGHKAIAITDHGCVQSFTDALHVIEDWKGAPKVAGTDETIKILYGCEGYYINDVDDRLAVQGSGNMPFDGEYVAFDLETTGLYRHDTIIEIGAVLMKQGQELDRFQTFVNPKQKLHPKIVELTGITDDMLKGAPTIDQILPKFLEFVGDRVLVAHNADFDANFIRRACVDLGLTWDKTFVDTLTISQCLLNGMQKYTLDVVAKKFDLADFNHHRAGDDALVCGRIAGRLFEMLAKRGVADVQGINEAMLPLRPNHRQEAVRCQHIVLFAKNQMGLRNLYRLISESNLKFFRKFPRIFKSELLKYREGLIIGSACENNEVYQAVLSGKSPEEIRRLASFYDYLEVQPISNNRFMLSPKKVDKDGKEVEPPIARNEEQLRQFNREIVELGQQMADGRFGRNSP